MKHSTILLVFLILCFKVLFTVNHNETNPSELFLLSDKFSSNDKIDNDSTDVYKPRNLQLNKQVNKISHNDNKPNKKRTLAELGLIIGGIWAYDHYWVDYDWAEISWKSVTNNFKHGFEWDTGKFSMNQILHPYSGNIYFNAARSNGYSFSQSIPFTIGGSMCWELFMENHYPSINDMITTSISGAALGEMLYRLSDFCLDKNSVGLEYYTRELLSSLISPVYAINRMLDSKEKEEGNRFEKPPLDVVISLGGKYRDPERYEKVSSTSFAVDLFIQYGNEHNDYEINNPYDYFSIFTGIETIEGNSLGFLLSDGNLITSKTNLTGKDITHHGLFQQFNYLNNAVYKLSTSSLGYGMSSKFELSKKTSLIVKNNLMWIVLGGSDSPYPKMEGIDLEYNLGPGFSYQNRLQFETAKGLEINFNLMSYWIKSVQGSDGEELITYAIYQLSLPIYKFIHYSIYYISYNRFGAYNKFKDIKKHTEAIRTTINIHF